MSILTLLNWYLTKFPRNKQNLGAFILIFFNLVETKNMVSEQFFETGRYNELISVLSPQTEFFES